ncbi:MAG: hypothetical protein MJK10_10095 [Pseudomonadales bacterium]|nr:hypothetical protein [Pseudomonadales bacterium]NRA16059.1 hypothetical protein [Oceanospirillaceae bacterium]
MSCIYQSGYSTGLHVPLSDSDRAEKLQETHNMNDPIDYTSQRCHPSGLGDNCPCCDRRHSSGQLTHEAWQLDADIAFESFSNTTGMWP